MARRLFTACDHSSPPAAEALKQARAHLRLPVRQHDAPCLRSVGRRDDGERGPVDVAPHAAKAVHADEDVADGHDAPGRVRGRKGRLTLLQCGRERDPASGGRPTARLTSSRSHTTTTESVPAAPVLDWSSKRVFVGRGFDVCQDTYRSARRKQLLPSREAQNKRQRAHRGLQLAA